MTASEQHIESRSTKFRLALELSSIDRFAARLLMISFFLPKAAQVFAAMVACLYFVGRSIVSKEIIPKTNFIWASILGGFYLLNVLSLPLTPLEYHKFLGLLCERRVSILLMPFVFAIITQRFNKLIMGELLYFAYACFAVSALANADFLYHYAKGDIHILSHVQYRIMFEAFTDIHPTYMGMLLAFSVCITLLLYPVSTAVDKFIKYGLIYLLFVFLLSILAKSPIIALVLISAQFAYTKRKVLNKYKMLFAGLIVGIAVACYFIPFIGQRIHEMVQFAGAGKAGNVADNSVYVRQMIWHTETDLLRQYWLTGIGPGRILHMLHERYFFYSIYHQFPVGYYDPHNEYISDWLSFGIIGIILLLAAIVTHFIKALRMGNQLYFYLLIILSVTFFTETVLSRQKGVMFYAVFTSLFFFYKQNKTISQGK